MQISNKRGSIVDHILHELLQKGDSSQKYMQGSRSMKIDHSILLDNLVQGHGMSGGSRNRALQSRSKRSKRHMSMKQLKKCDLFNLPQELHKWVDLYASLSLYIFFLLLFRRICNFCVLFFFFPFSLGELELFFSHLYVKFIMIIHFTKLIFIWFSELRTFSPKANVI